MSEAWDRVADGNSPKTLPYIRITPFVPAHVGPNSVDLTLSPTMLTYPIDVLDSLADNPVAWQYIPPWGFVLMPGELYLGSTVEETECHGLLPLLETRSSLARLGVSCHLSAGFGDDGFRGTWTLEITVVKPVRLYPGQRVCQVSFAELKGARRPYAGRYLGQALPTASRGSWGRWEGDA